MDFPDFIYSFAPKPFLVLSAIRDFFPIGGVRESFAEAHRVYDSLGSGDKLQKVEADDGHGYSKPRRQAAYRWFARWLKSQEDDGAEQDVPIARPKSFGPLPPGRLPLRFRAKMSSRSISSGMRRVKQNRPALSLDKVRELSAFDPGEGQAEHQDLRNGISATVTGSRSSLTRVSRES